MKIIIDTNFIITAVKQKIQVFDFLNEDYPNCEIYVPNLVKKEIERISESNEVKISDKKAANVALDLIKRYNPKQINLETKDADAGIIRYILNKKEIIVGTLDRELKRKIKKINPGVKFLTIKEKKRISIQ